MRLTTRCLVINRPHQPQQRQNLGAPAVCRGHAHWHDQGGSSTYKNKHLKLKLRFGSALLPLSINKNRSHNLLLSIFPSGLSADRLVMSEHAAT